MDSSLSSSTEKSHQPVDMMTMVMMMMVMTVMVMMMMMMTVMLMTVMLMTVIMMTVMLMTAMLMMVMLMMMMGDNNYRAVIFVSLCICVTVGLGRIPTSLLILYEAF